MMQQMLLIMQTFANQSSANVVSTPTRPNTKQTGQTGQTGQNGQIEQIEQDRLAVVRYEGSAQGTEASLAQNWSNATSLTVTEVNKLNAAAQSMPNFAVLLMCRLFSLDELKRPDISVTGYAYNGHQSANPVDPERISLIKAEAFRRYDIKKEQDKKKAWKDMKNAMNKKLWSIRNMGRI